MKICTLEDGVCIGCGRTQDEIREWVIMTDNQREKIMKNLNLISGYLFGFGYKMKPTIDDTYY